VGLKVGDVCPGEAEVANFKIAVTIYKQVAGLEVSVKDAR